MVAPNEPLGNKKNIGIRQALRFDWDYLIEVGSDDVWTSLMWDYLQPYFRQNNPFFGFLSLYIYNLLTDEARFVGEYNIDTTDTLTAIGVGRCVRRDIVERSLDLWNPSAHFGMDGYSSAQIWRKTGIRATVLDTKRLPVVCDIKTATCMSGWHEFDDMSEPVDAGWVREVFHINPLTLKNLKDFSHFHDAVLKVSYESRISRHEAFQRVNESYEDTTGEKRFASYESYKNRVSKKFKK